MIEILRELKYIFRERLVRVILVSSVAIISLYLYNEDIKTNYNRSADTRMRIDFVRDAGGPCMPIIAQCCTSRNLTEGIYARRNEMPGGFSFQSDCDVVYTGRLYAEQHFTIKKINDGKP